MKFNAINRDTPQLATLLVNRLFISSILLSFIKGPSIIIVIFNTIQNVCIKVGLKQILYIINVHTLVYGLYE